MEILPLILLFVFGVIVGSFLNVVILRYNTGKTVGGRSICMSCGKKLACYELIPIISYLFLLGSCGKCKSKISIQYPLVEALTGFLFAFTYMNIIPVSPQEFVLTAIYIIIACLLVIITVYDIKHKIIPNEFVYGFIFLAFIQNFIASDSWFTLPSWQIVIAGPVLALPFLILWLISKGEWMGFGDLKLMLGIGWLLGINPGANAVVLAFWIAAIISISWLLITKHSVKPKTEVPFGPYLILGMYIVFFYQIQVIDFNLAKEIIFSLF
jgi:prepilin signal peptidase PulO-like enzyme (type II secretory pathway)